MECTRRHSDASHSAMNHLEQLPRHMGNQRMHRCSLSCLFSTPQWDHQENNFFAHCHTNSYFYRLLIILDGLSSAQCQTLFWETLRLSRSSARFFSGLKSLFACSLIAHMSVRMNMYAGFWRRELRQRFRQ